MSVLLPFFDSGDAGAFLAAAGLAPLDRRSAADPSGEPDQLFEILFARAVIGMSIAGRDGRFLRANDAFCQFIGRSEKELLSLTVAEVTHPDDLSLTRRHFELAAEGDRPSFNGEKRYLHRDGTTVWGSTSIVWLDLQGKSLSLALTQDITARKQAEKDVQDAFEVQKTLIHASPLAIFVHDPDGTIRLWNRSAERIFGWRAEEVVGGPNPILPPGETETFRRLWERTCAGESVHGKELFRCRKDGSVLPISLSTAPLRHADGRLIGLMSIIEDISERKAAERALLESEARYRLLFEHNPHPMWVYDLETLAFLAVNEAAIERYGWSREEFLSMTIRDIRPAEDVARLEENIQKVSGGIDRAGVWRHRRRDGTIMEVEITSHTFDFRGRRGELVLATDITDRLQAEREVSRLAYFDHLTGLPNRTLLHDRLEQLILQADRQGGRMALLFLDLDQFKRINDSLGHATGDELLRSVAQRLQSCLRRSDTVARLGGDEFVILLSPVREEKDVSHIAGQVQQALAPAHKVAAGEIYANASIGIALFPADGRDPETLLRHGDLAMYEAKARGRNTFRFFSEAMNRKARQRLEMENDLRRGIEQKQFFLVYQPQIDLETGRITAVEALLRWQHPQRGAIPPAEFIPVAEETGLILNLGEWLLKTACRRCRDWQDAGYPQLRMAVNISGGQLRQGDFAAIVRQALQASRLDPSRLELELTESVLMEASREGVHTLHALAGMGVRLTLDDFGTGYSSLSHLRTLPISRIKIAQFFVRGLHADPQAAAIVEAIVAIARSLQLEAIAEGVENREELGFLLALGCREAQGFYFSHPLAEADLLRAFADGLGRSGTCPFRMA